ncbi:MAG: PAS domain-containing protein [Prevotella sp.]|nr:PAS domain-containing protein [Prevotella sp.]
MTPYIYILTAAALLLAVLLFYGRRRKRRKKGEEQVLSVRDLTAMALKISAHNVIVFDISSGHTSLLSGNMLPEGGASKELFKEHVHPDDVDMLVSRIMELERGESQQAEFCYRWNYEFGGGKPRWGWLRNTSVAEYAGGDKPIRVISALVDETELRRQQSEEAELGNKYRLIFENSVVALSFYSADGWLLDANAIMREICHFDSDSGDDFFSNTNLYEQAPFNELIDRNHVEELWICFLSVIPERDMHVYLEIHLHPIYDDQGELVYIALTVRDVSQEREMYRQARENDIRLREANEDIRHYEQELRYMMVNSRMQAWRISLDRNCLEFYSGLNTPVRTFNLEDMRHIFVNKEDDFVRSLENPAEAIAHPLSYQGQVYPIVTHTSTEKQWVQINSIPEYDDNGRLLGSFGVWRNITALMEKQEQLRRETERANDSGRMKSVFLANMTHEIRTPLNAIVGFSDLLQAVESPEDRREMIRVIHNNCDMLLRLINDILVLSNVDANAMQIVCEEVDFAREFDDICQSLAQRVSNPAVEFQKENPFDTLMASIDKNRIQQVITNFVTNAVKYTQQGHIRVGYRQEERDGRPGIYVYCSDTGDGIPEDQLSRVFERFVKLNDFIQGTGLGLSICKAIIDKCGGQIGVESQLGKGSDFWFWIPRYSEE